MKLKPLTPVHVGDGEEIIPWEYSPSEGRVNVYPVEHIVKELSGRYSGPRLRNLLLTLRNEVRRSGFSRNFGDFIRSQGVHVEPQYSIPCKSNLKDREFKSIKSFVKSLGRVYIPGSEIKGALRTVFLFGVVLRELKQERMDLAAQITQTIRRTLHNPPEKEKDPWKSASNSIEWLILRRGSPDRNDAKYDLFKALKVYDSGTCEPERCLYVDNVTIVGSKSRSFSDPHELLTPGTEFDVKVEIDEDQKKALKKATSNPYVDLLTEEFLHESAAEFARYVLTEDIRFFESVYPQALDSLSGVESAVGEKEFVVRIGKHQGFLSTTVMVILKLGNRELYESFFRKVITRSDREPNKTRKITQSDQSLGWCKLVKT